MFSFVTYAHIELTESQAVTFIGLLRKLHPPKSELYKTPKIGFEVNVKFTTDERELIEDLCKELPKS